MIQVLGPLKRLVHKKEPFVDAHATGLRQETIREQNFPTSLQKALNWGFVDLVQQLDSLLEAKLEEVTEPARVKGCSTMFPRSTVLLNHEAKIGGGGTHGGKCWCTEATIG